MAPELAAVAAAGLILGWLLHWLWAEIGRRLGPRAELVDEELLDELEDLLPAGRPDLLPELCALAAAAARVYPTAEAFDGALGAQEAKRLGEQVGRLVKRVGYARVQKSLKAAPIEVSR